MQPMVQALKLGVGCSGKPPLKFYVYNRMIYNVDVSFEAAKQKQVGLPGNVSLQSVGFKVHSWCRSRSFDVTRTRSGEDDAREEKGALGAPSKGEES